MLIGTDVIRTWLSLPEGDKTPNITFETLAQAVQGFAEAYTNRQLEATYYNGHRDYSIFDGKGEYYMYTKQYPVSWVGAVYVDADRAWGSASLVASADIIIDWDIGKVMSEAGRFTRGRRNVRIDYIAGYGGATASSYPLPYDLKQVMIEMAVQSFKEGITGVHTVQGVEETKFMQMLSRNSMWRKTLNAYKNYSKRLE